MICPFCKSKKVRGIIYGEIGFRDEQDEIEFKKRYVLGGCTISDDSPIFHCDNCSKDFGTIKEKKRETVEEGGKKRSDIRPGLRVAIVKKIDQPTGKLTEGIVADILTNVSFHPRGIKVRLQTGEVGRVQKICEK